ncbi:tyrosine lyase ThiH [Hypnocyclicus thermotrophus]|uniref:Tyrosine lyase ThiH n=1 Tax=Hypnocyclicus thermotrophus TaxID=1627895 RepID=A0AA46E0A9_9FUSO|nr:2-iminoacetate synthase ThiH [Hypnocyclicus thermotrophus]TDT71976.1 tyrosine lyase ThiH [Hypnocyclicus thermotrophus]
MSFYDVIKKYEDFNIKEYLENVSYEDVEKTINKENLNEFDFLNLISNTSLEYIEIIARKSQKLTKRYFGNTISLYAPLYISNYCTNKCTYCGFNKENKIKRKHLSYEEIEKEAKELAKTGIKHVLFLTGEAKELVSFEYIKNTLIILKKYFKSISIEIYPLKENEYRKLKNLGLDGVTIYQETYDLETYKKVHLEGQKKDYFYRLDTPERVARAGVRQIGIGALYGLSDIYKDAFFSALHAKYLMDKYIDCEISISLPRMKYSESKFKPYQKLDNKKFIQIMLAFRLYLKYIGINISTRESAEFRNNLIGLGATKYSAGSKTDVGGYTKENKSTPQFETDDKRDVNEICNAIKNRGYQPVFKDWELII